MATRSLESQVLHDGFDAYVLPILAPLGFVRAETPRDHQAVGWTNLVASCALPSDTSMHFELFGAASTSPRCNFIGPIRGIELMCSQRDPSAPNLTTLSHAMSYFENAGDFRRGVADLVARRKLAIEFLACEFVVASDQLVAAVPELQARVDSARRTELWRLAPARANELWATRALRSEVDDRIVLGTFTFFGAGLVTVQADGQRYTFKFDTSRIDRNLSPMLSGWWTTPAGTQRPSKLTIGNVVLCFDPAGTLLPN